MPNLGKQAINLATIFSLVLVGFSFVRLLPLNVEWQAVLMALIVAGLFMTASYLSQHRQSAVKVNQLALPSTVLELVSKLHQSLGLATAQYYIYWPANNCYRHTKTGQILSLNHPVIHLLQKQQLLQRSQMDQAVVPDMYLEEFFRLFDQQQADSIGALSVANVPHPLVIFFTADAITEATLLKANQQFGQLFYLEIDRQQTLSPQVAVAATGDWARWMQFGVLGFLFVLFTLWYLFNEDITGWGWTDFSSVYGVTALVSGVIGLLIAKLWVHLPRFSLSLRWISLGLLLQTVGQFSYSFYSNTIIAYPSFGDVGYFGSAVSYLMAAIYLARSYGLTIKGTRLVEWLMFVVTLGSIYTFAYLVFFQNYLLDWSDPVKTFLDIGYPLVQGTYVAIAAVAIFRAYQKPSAIGTKALLLLIGFAWQFLCDYIFIYQAYAGTWMPNSWNDYMYFVSYVWFGGVMVIFRKE